MQSSNCFSSQSHYYLGTAELPPKQSASNKDFLAELDLGPVANNNGLHRRRAAAEEEKMAGDVNTDHVLDKVDSLLQYINDSYLSGELAIYDKTALKKELAEYGKPKGVNGKKKKRNWLQVERRIYNGDDRRGSTPISRRTLVLID